MTTQQRLISEQKRWHEAQDELVFRQFIRSRDGHVMVGMGQGNKLNLKFFKSDNSSIGEKISLSFRQAGKLAKLINHALATRDNKYDKDLRLTQFTHLKF